MVRSTSWWCWVHHRSPLVGTTMLARANPRTNNSRLGGTTRASPETRHRIGPASGSTQTVLWSARRGSYPNGRAPGVNRTPDTRFLGNAVRILRRCKDFGTAGPSHRGLFLSSERWIRDDDVKAVSVSNLRQLLGWGIAVCTGGMHAVRVGRGIE